MEFKLKYTNAVSEPCGVFVEDIDMMAWIDVASEFNSSSVRFYPVPGKTANSIAGALLIVDNSKGIGSNKHVKVQSIGTCFFLPENAEVSPKLDEKSIATRFNNKPHFFHPVYGLIELTELTDWATFVDLKPLQVQLIQPKPGLDSPQKLGNYFIRDIEPENVLDDLIKKTVPNRDKLDSPPLTTWEKFKMKALRTLVGKTKSNEGKSGPDSALNQNVKPLNKKSWWKRKQEGMEDELHELEERNKKELDKLMVMLDKDPDAALRYALPIDRSGYSRGPDVGFKMSKRWGLGTSNSSGGGGSVNIGESETDILRRKYSSMADQYIAEEKWEKASFVYLELLSDPNLAGNTLERGGKYEAAAAVFLAKCKNKVRAASCYESGKFYGRAIDLNEEMDNQMKVGDLQTKMGNVTKAKTAYSKEVSKLLVNKRFLDAGTVSNEKLHDLSKAREFYMKGWDDKQRPDECLNSYLDTYNLSEKKKNINSLHRKEFVGQDAHQFIGVLKTQLNKEKDLQKDVELVVYETVARNSRLDKSIVEALKDFNKGDLVTKDIMRFKQTIRKR